MTEKIKQSEKVREGTPGDIGNFTDENSLARKLMDTIDRARDRASVLATLFDLYFNCANDSTDVSGVEVIAKDILRDLLEAHEMICSSRLYKGGGDQA